MPGSNNRFEVVSRKAVLQNAIGGGLSAVGPGSAVRKKQTNGKFRAATAARSNPLYPMHFSPYSVDSISTGTAGMISVAIGV